MFSSPASQQVSILNAAIIDDPRHCRDPLIALTDIAASIPSTPIPSGSTPNWKRLVSTMADASALSEAREQVLTAVSERISDFSIIVSQLSGLRDCSPAPQLAHGPSGAAIHASLATLLQECLPLSPPASTCNHDRAASHWWNITKGELQKLRRLRLSIPTTARPQPFQQAIIRSIFSHWKTSQAPLSNAHRLLAPSPTSSGPPCKQLSRGLGTGSAHQPYSLPPIPVTRRRH